MDDNKQNAPPISQEFEPEAIIEASTESSVESGLTKITLPDGKRITLNPEQDKALELLSKWVFPTVHADEDLFFILSGYGGTGKTTISLALANFYKSVKRTKQLCVSAPTHKAKRVVMDATQLEGQTLQGLLGLAPNTDLENFDPNKPEFAQKFKPSIHRYGLIILDEVSMINKGLWALLKKLAIEHGTKLMLVGDPAQLPPVKESVSPIFTDTTISNKFSLTKSERQASDNPISIISNKLRLDQKSDCDYLIQTDIVEGKGILVETDLGVFGRSIIEAFKDKEQREHSKVLCWTNNRIAFWNNSIRKSLYRDRIFPQVGEVLMAYVSYQDSISNSRDYSVDKIVPSSRSSYVNRDEEIELEGYAIHLRDLIDNHVQTFFILDHSKPEVVENFKYVFNSYLRAAKLGGRWREYYWFKESILLLVDIRTQDGTLICRKDLDYSYGISVHKSQGSSYNNVFIDWENLNANTNIVDRNKLKYVALTRPRNLAIIYKP